MPFAPPLGRPAHAGLRRQLAWAVENQFFNTFLYNEITPDPRPISWMIAVTTLVATLTVIFMGLLRF